jgi:hypothetical protein
VGIVTRFDVLEPRIVDAISSSDAALSLPFHDVHVVADCVYRQFRLQRLNPLAGGSLASGGFSCALAFTCRPSATTKLRGAAQHSAAQTSITFVGSNGYVAEAGHVEHDATLTGREASIIMASAANGEG